MPTGQPGVADEIRFAAEESGHRPASFAEPWLILVVDDDHDVHALTRMLLASMTFKSRPVRLLDAYTAAEAEALLREHPGVALILLDVVMETEDAGLRLVHRIRQDLCNRNVRIVLRTGQPGAAPERTVLLEYDIDNYRAKSKLTADRMFTTVIAGLRTFDTLMAFVREREAREKADREAEAHRAALAALERRRADERKAELDAIAQHLQMIILPRMHRAAEQAHSIAQAGQGVGPDSANRPSQPAAAELGAVSEAWLTMCGDLGELLESLRAVD